MEGLARFLLPAIFTRFPINTHLAIFAGVLLMALPFGGCGQMEALKDALGEGGQDNPYQLELGPVYENTFDGESAHYYAFTSADRQTVRIYLSAFVEAGWVAHKGSFKGVVLDPPGPCVAVEGWAECDVRLDEEEQIGLVVNNPTKESGLYVLWAYNP